MTRKSIIRLLGIVCMITLIFSISQTLVAGEKNESSGKDGPSKGNSYSAVITRSTITGTVVIGVETMGDVTGRSTSFSGNILNMDFTFGGYFPNAAPVQGPMYGATTRTKLNKYESGWIFHCKNNNGSLAYIMIGKGKGRIFNDNTWEENTIIYLFVPPWFTDANGDLVPDNAYEAVLTSTDHTIGQHLSTALPELPFPSEYP
jgi:hypothetical protein